MTGEQRVRPALDEKIENLSMTGNKNRVEEKGKLEKEKREFEVQKA